MLPARFTVCLSVFVDEIIGSIFLMKSVFSLFFMLDTYVLVTTYICTRVIMYLLCCQVFCSGTKLWHNVGVTPLTKLSIDIVIYTMQLI